MAVTGQDLALGDKTVNYYLALGYGQSQANSLAAAEIAKSSAEQTLADQKQADAQAQAATANQSFIDNLTQKLSDLFTQEQTQVQDTTSKQVQAVIDASAGNAAINTANPSFTMPAAVTPANTAAAAPANNMSLWIAAAVAIGLFLWVRRR